MLQRGDLLPHFTVGALDGHEFAYASIWQQRNLVLVFVGGPSAATAAYAGRLVARTSDFDAADARCVVTTESLEGFPPRGFVIADRWGEIVHVASAGPGGALPSVDELLEWVTYTQMRCPECEGETK